jgi:hypothetical protein
MPDYATSVKYVTIFAVLAKIVNGIKLSGMDYREKILQIRQEFLKGNITFDEAKIQVMPLLAEMNEKGEKIAKKFGKKYKKLTFGYVFR